MAKAKDVELQNFFVFNPTLGRKEGEEHKKLLYFYPSYEALDAKIKVIGLSEAIISFMETFTDFPCESLHTQKTKQFYFKPEQDFWIVMTVNIPSMEKQVDGRIKLEYCEDHVIDKIYQTVLERSYKMFKMFNGSISHILNKGNIADLKERFEHFFNKYLSTLRIDHPDILDVFNGMHYLPLERILYLKVQSFVNRLEANIPEIKHTIMLYNYQLIRSGINLDDLRIMYSFLLMGLYPAMMEQDFHVSSFSDKVQSPLLLSPGKFVLGPPSIYDTSDPGQIPRVHIGKDLETYQLLAYRLYDVVVILLIEEGVTPSFDLFRKLDDHFRHHLECLAVELAENKVKRMQIPLSEAGVKFIYFNKTNAAQKSSMHTLDGVVLNVHPDVMRIVSHLNLELNSSGTSSDEDCETVVKMANDCWVVGKKAEDREIYVVVNQKNANLIEINEEVKKLCSTHFCNIFFFD